jgi:HD-like signal output (HDOD) protein
MSEEIAHGIVGQILAALESNQLELPTLPDIAFKMRKAFDDPNLSADQLVNILSLDAVISSQIIKAANSPAFSSGQAVVSVRPAVMRLGYRMLRNLVMSSALTKLFQAENSHIRQKLKELWKHSLHVATVSYVLALKHKHLSPEEALLAGLVHDIGELPLYIYADRHRLQLSEAELKIMVRKFRGEVGKKLLQHWNFSDEIVKVIDGHEDLLKTDDWDQVDYVDIVMMANLQTFDMATMTEWENVSAAHKLGLSAEECRNFIATHAKILEKMSSMFGYNTAEQTPIPRKITDTTDEHAFSIQPKNHPVKTSVWVGILKLFGFN